MANGQRNIRRTKIFYIANLQSSHWLLSQEDQTLPSAVCNILNFRDKIQERFVELLAQAAARAAAPVRPDLVDESRLCGSPGKIVDVGILEQLLRLPPEQHIFYGPGTCRRDVSCPWCQASAAMLALLGCYTALSVNPLPMFLDKISVPSSSRISWTLKMMGLICCPETSVKY